MRRKPLARKSAIRSAAIKRVADNQEWQRHCYLKIIYDRAQIYIENELSVIPVSDTPLPRPTIREILNRELLETQAHLQTSSLSKDDRLLLEIRLMYISDHLSHMSDADDRINKECVLRLEEQNKRITDEVNAIHEMDAPKFIKDAHFSALLKER